MMISRCVDFSTSSVPALKFEQVHTLNGFSKNMYHHFADSNNGIKPGKEIDRHPLDSNSVMQYEEEKDDGSREVKSLAKQLNHLMQVWQERCRPDVRI